MMITKKATRKHDAKGSPKPKHAKSNSSNSERIQFFMLVIKSKCV